MMKYVVALLQTLIGLYCIGAAARQNPKIDAFVERLEFGYGEFNQRLKTLQVRDGVSTLQRIYGLVAIAAIILFLVASSVPAARPFGATCSVIFMLSFLGWFSIKWCTQHKKAVSEFAPQAALMVCGPLVLALFDHFFGGAIVHQFMFPLAKICDVVGCSLPSATHPFLQGALLSVVLAVSLFVFYLFTWALVSPIAFLSLGLIALAVSFAKFIHLITPVKPFVGLAMVVFVIVTFAPLWL